MKTLGVNDNFFLLGGNSLLGAQVIGQVRDTFDVENFLLSLFDHPTVSELSAEIERLLVAKLGAMSEDEAKRLAMRFGNEHRRMTAITAIPRISNRDTLSLYHLLDPEVLANPYPLYTGAAEEDPVHWDPFLHAWVVTRYADVVTVLHDVFGRPTPTPEQLSEHGPVGDEPDCAGDGQADVVSGLRPLTRAFAAWQRRLYAAASGSCCAAHIRRSQPSLHRCR